mgnify:CR=1 FL=1
MVTQLEFFGIMKEDSFNVLSTIFTHALFGKIAALLVGVALIILLTNIFKNSIHHTIEGKKQRFAVRKLVDICSIFATIILACITFAHQLGNLAILIGGVSAGVAFALKGIIASVAGWLALGFGKQYRIGDRVSINSITGDVIDIGILKTTIMELGEWIDGDLYTGRIVTIPNNYIFNHPVFNYSKDFLFLWDEIKIPVKFGSNVDKSYQVLKEVAGEITSEYAEQVSSSWNLMQRKYMIEQARLEPMVTLKSNDNWNEFTVRYIVDYRQRRSTKDLLFKNIMKRFDQEKDLETASATFEVVGTPTIPIEIPAKK